MTIAAKIVENMIHTALRRKNRLLFSRTVTILLLAILAASCTGKRQTFSFIQLSDPQLGMENYAQDLANLEQAVQQINATDVDFVVICGDLVHDAADSSFSDVREVIEQFEVPWYIVPGNHDIGFVPDNSSIAWYREYFGDDYYTLDHKGNTFIFTNTQLWKSDVGEASATHTQWFETTLEDLKKNRRVVVVGHYPLYIKELEEEETYSTLPIEKRMELLDLFEKNNVKAYLTGHRHAFVQNYNRGVQLVSVESTTKNFDDRPLGYRQWEVTPDTMFHSFYKIEQ